MKKTLFLIVMAMASLYATAATVPDETLRYSVNFRWGIIDANAGIATLTTYNIPGSGQFRATLTGKSVDLLGHYYAVGDTITGTIMASDLRPVYTEHLSSENGEFSIETVTYNHSANSSEGEIVRRYPDGKVLRSRVSHYAGGLTLDLLAVFYYIRQLDYPRMQPGEEVTVNIFSGNNPETLRVTYVGQSDCNGTPSYNIRLNFSAQAGGHTNADEMRVAIAADSGRIPLLVEGSLKVGHLLCRYIGND